MPSKRRPSDYPGSPRSLCHPRPLRRNPRRTAPREERIVYSSAWALYAKFFGTKSLGGMINTCVHICIYIHYTFIYSILYTHLSIRCSCVETSGWDPSFRHRIQHLQNAWIRSNVAGVKCRCPEHFGWCNEQRTAEERDTPHRRVQEYPRAQVDQSAPWAVGAWGVGGLAPKARP